MIDNFISCMRRTIEYGRKSGYNPIGVGNRLITALMLFWSGLFLTACSMVSSNSMYEGHFEGNYVGCRGDAGSYFLARSVFNIQLKQDGKGDVGLRIDLDREPDKEHGYCLDFLSSKTAEEAIYIDKTRGNLLKKITTRSDDQSADIAKNIIKTIFVALSGNPDFDNSLRRTTEAGLGGNMLFEGRYDPFNKDQAALVNHSLTKHGVCLLIEGQHDKRYSGAMDYCDHPLKYKSIEKTIKAASNYGSRIEYVNYTKGILFRPRLPHRYFVYYKRRDPHNGEKRWRLVQSRAVNMENKSPLIALAVDRAFFTHRYTTVEFDKGALTDVNIEKGSELADAMSVPLALADSIAALPANVVKVKIDLTNRRANLINAQRALINELESQKGERRTLQNLTDGNGNEVPKADKGAGDIRGLEFKAPKAPDPDVVINEENSAQCLRRCARDSTFDSDSRECQSYCSCITVGQVQNDPRTVEALCRSNLQDN